MMAEIKKQYDPVVLDGIKKFLENEHKRGVPRYYDIAVDGLKVVERTNEPERFNLHEEQVNDLTEQVVINIYTSSPTSAHIPTRYILSMREEKPQQQQSLSGMLASDIEARLREKWDCERVKEELEATRQKLKESEEWAEMLQAKLSEKEEEAKKKSEFEGLTGLLKDTVVPLISGNKSGSQTLEGNDKTEADASFKMKTEEAGTLTPQEQGYIAFGKFIQSKFTQPESDMLVEIVQALADDKKNLNTVHSLLNLNNNQQKTETAK